MPVFFDTNILVYCTDAANQHKRTVARQAVAKAGLSGDAWVSTQVLIELYNVLTRKQKIPAHAATDVVMGYTAWPVVESDVVLVTNAIDLSAQYRLSIWDAMVLVAATRCGAQTLYTEDLQHGQQFGMLTVVNPFLTAS